MTSNLPTPTHQPNATFVLAGKAIFTVSQGDTRYTYRVTRKDPDPDQARKYGAAPTFFVGLLTGSDNETGYSYLGILNSGTGAVKLTKASRFTDDSQPVRTLRAVAGYLVQDEPVPATYIVRHANRCGRCGRTLTVPESVDSGIGPDCAAQMGLVQVVSRKPVTVDATLVDRPKVGAVLMTLLARHGCPGNAAEDAQARMESGDLTPAEFKMIQAMIGIAFPMVVHQATA